MIMVIKFFQTSTGRFISHHEGLRLEQISFLKSLNMKDKLILYINDDGTLSLKKVNETPRTETEILSREQEEEFQQ
jgi:hypothetical protein